MSRALHPRDLERMTKGQRRALKRRALFDAQGGKCYWCKRPMLWIEGALPDGRRKPGAACTLDHMYSRLDPRRRKLPQRLVAACSTCNGTRSKMECQDVARNGRLTREVYDPTERLMPKIRP